MAENSAPANPQPAPVQPANAQPAPAQPPPQPQAVPKERNAPNPNSTNDNMIFCMKAKFYWWITLILIAILFVFMLGWLGAPRWGWQETSDGDKIEGSLIAITKSEIDELPEDPYNDILEDSDWCDSDELEVRIANDAFCDQMEDSRDGGAVYIVFGLFCLMIYIIWALLLLLEIFAKPLPAFLGYLPPALIWFFWIFAFIVGSAITDVKFRDDCDHASWPIDEDICAGEGPALALFIFLITTLLFPVYFFLWWKKGQGALAEPKQSDQVAYQAPPEQKVPAIGINDTQIELAQSHSFPPPMQSAPPAQEYRAVAPPEQANRE